MKIKCDENDCLIPSLDNFVLASSPGIWTFYPLSQEALNSIPEEVRVNELNGNKNEMICFYRGQIRKQVVNDVHFRYLFNQDFLFAVSLADLRKYLPKHAQRYGR